MRTQPEAGKLEVHEPSGGKWGHGPQESHSVARVGRTGAVPPGTVSSSRNSCVNERGKERMSTDRRERAKAITCYREF